MSDAKRPSHCIRADSPPRIAVARDVFLDALAAKGARTGEQRAALLDTTRANVDHWVAGRVEPKLSTARRIARTLDRDLDELWPADTEVAA